MPDVSPPPPELWLRFPCSTYGHLLGVPLRKSARRTVACPRCHASQQVPDPDAETIGADALPPEQPQPVEIPCPHGCGTLHVDASEFGQRKRCPRCRALFTLQLVADADDAPVPPQPPAAVVASLQEDPPPPIVYGQAEPPHRHQLWDWVRLPDSPRAVWRMVYWPVQFVLPVLLVLTAKEFDIVAIGIIGLVLICPPVAVRISALIGTLLLRAVRCPGCHQEHEAVGRWKCGCGFVDHRERHVLTFRCPMCKSYLGWTNCLRCDATIFLR